MRIQYAWLTWSLFLLLIWLGIFLTQRSRESKKMMLGVSLWTSLLGLTEPLFVPEYWSPPSVFDLAMKTGFDVESLIFCFGVGGIAAVIYERVFHRTGRRIDPEEKQAPRHRYHALTLISGPAMFFALVFTSNLNPIYCGFMGMLFGGLMTWYCRPDLKKKMMATAFLFLGIYFLYFVTLILAFPGYVGAVWNLKALSGILVLGVPLEELMFALGFGFYWSSVYEHVMWRALK